MKKKTVVIHQPDFIPYLGFFHRLMHADLYIVLDHVQFPPRNWTHRDKIKNAQGEQWLTLSVKKTPRETPINRVELSTEVNWAQDHLNILRENYQHAAGYLELWPHVQKLYHAPPHLLADFNLRAIDTLCDLLDIRIQRILSSSLRPQGGKNELLIDLLQKTEATRYLTGTGSRDYLQTGLFNAAGIQVLWQEFDHPSYPQQFGEFIPFLSTLDALFNCGIEGTRELLKGMSA